MHQLVQAAPTGAGSQQPRCQGQGGTRPRAGPPPNGHLGGGSLLQSKMSWVREPQLYAPLLAQRQSKGACLLNSQLTFRNSKWKRRNDYQGLPLNVSLGFSDGCGHKRSISSFLLIHRWRGHWPGQVKMRKIKDCTNSTSHWCLDPGILPPRRCYHCRKMTLTG